MVKQSSIARGKKWTDVKAKAEFENDSKIVKWLATQTAIIADIEAYKATKIPETKSKVKK